MSKLNFDDYNKLSPTSQEDYINSGGVVEYPTAEQKEMVSDLHAEARKSAEPLESFAPEDDLSHSITSVEPQMGTSLSEVKESADSPSASYIDGFDIKDPLELVILLDDDIRTGKITLHPWQIQFLIDFSNPANIAQFPFQALMRACNGSGKDKYILAPCAVWLNMRYRKARGVVTSSSGVQLDNQTCAYITLLCNEANRKWGNIWKCNYRYYECLPTEAPIICYATDEPGKAEGFHPLEAGARMGIYMSEDKTIPDEINTAINRCSGYTHRIHVSTPGDTSGHFFDLCSTAVSRKEIKNVKEVRPEDYIQYVVTYKECPHIPESDYRRTIRNTPGGENSSVIKSQFFAEFGTTGEMVVIPSIYVWRASKRTEKDWVPEPHNRGGLDLSDGGDETVLVVRNGNRILKLIPFRFDNSEDTIAFLNEAFKDNGLVHRDALIYADCGGIGKPMLDRMRRQGWSNIRYCDNRAKTSRPKTYRNWGAQSWFHFADCIKTDPIIIPDDVSLIKQLSTRYYKIMDGAIHQLLSKIEMRSRGYHSPDRADAVVLAFTDYKQSYVSEYDKDERKPTLEGEEPKPEKVRTFDLRSWARGSSMDYNRVFTVNAGQKDWSEIQDQLNELNKQVLMNKG